MTTFIEPRILVLEGLWADTREIIDDAGGDADECAPWDIEDIEDKLLSGDYHGLVLTGGSDIDPRLYNEKPHKEVYGVDYVRDTGELYALEIASQLGIPVLGICRGSQIMCAFRGGKLTQHIEGHRGGNHPVTAEPDARTFRRAINGRDMQVISLHHQCVRRPGKGMRIAARAMDGTPEAIESKDGLWLGCQFHPEINATQNGQSFAIFQWLVQAAATHAGGRARRVMFKEVKRKTWRSQASTAVAVATGKRPAKPAKHRKAGTRSYVEGTTTPGGDAHELHLCPECAMLFDFKRDRDDHVEIIHNRDSSYVWDEARYPELLPPAGSEAWDDDAIMTYDEASELAEQIRGVTS